MNKELLQDDAQAEPTLEEVRENLLASGKKRGVLVYTEIMNRMSPFDQDSDQIDDFFEQLTDLGIEVVNEA